MFQGRDESEHGADGEREVIAVREHDGRAGAGGEQRPGARGGEAREDREAERAAHHERRVDDARGEPGLAWRDVAHRGEQHRVQGHAAAQPEQEHAPDGRQARMLSGPIVGTLLRFAAPTIVVVTVQALVSVMETYFVGFLGTDALAGVAVVFPVVMLMQMMSAGGMGGGVSSAVARALGGGRQADANALVTHSILIAVALGLAFTVGALIWGPALYRLLGGRGEALAAAVTYSNIVFAGSVALWLFNTLGACAAPATWSRRRECPCSARRCSFRSPPSSSSAGVRSQGSGSQGAGYAFVSYYVGATLVLGARLMPGRSAVALRLRGVRLDRRRFADILGVGAISALMTVQANLIVIVVTGIVGAFGTAALAGYGLAARLDYLLIPLLFGLGSAAVTLVGTNVGAGHADRARRIAWTAVAIGAGVTELIGLTVAAAPRLWLGIFTNAPEVLGVGETYLRIVGPFYGFFGAAMILYFSAQGAGRMLWPFVGGIVRLLLATLGAWLAVHQFGIGLTGVWWLIAASFVVFGVVNTLALRPGARRLSRA
jgi:Na+-driven multidrug efflux pump